MVFRNERTWLNAVEAGKTEEFHERYEAGIEKVQQGFGDKHPMFINGKEVWSRETFKDVSPFNTKIVLGTFQKGTRAHAKRGIDAARAAFRRWSQTPWPDRVRIFRRAADLIAERKYEYSALMSFEMGSFMAGERTRAMLKPYGAWAVVAPFNFPFAIAAGMSSGAMITGNTVVFKPATDTPYMGLKLCELLHEAGLPPGVFNYVTGPGSTVGEELVENDGVDGFIFTGSRSVGVGAFRRFNKGRPKPIVTEMGGKNPAIVTASADLEKAALGVMRAAFGYGGQKCSACSRVLVDRRVKDAFVEKLVAETQKVKIGDPTQRDVYLGPVINEAAVATYQKAVQEIRRSKGRILAGGTALKGSGYFVEPTIVDGLPRNHRINKEELFVPILSIIAVDGMDDAIRVANDVDYGLTAGIFSREPAEGRRVFAGGEAGGVV